MQNIPHISVLYREVIQTFQDIQDGIIIDCTMGYGGHSSLILEQNPDATLIGIDQDQTAITYSKELLSKYGDRVIVKKGRFASLIGEIIQEYGNENIKGILADIGVSSLQLDQKDRGFSYESDTLDMRMNTQAPLDAKEVVNNYSKESLEHIIQEYGELRNYKKITNAIILKRPFSSAKELYIATKEHLPQGKKIHPATLLMQAIRIEVNDELGELKTLLQIIQDNKLQDAKIAIISFHSLEDRIVKQTYNAWSKNCICPSEAMRCTCSRDNSLGKILTKKPITAKEDELKQNPRSRSAKMRVFSMSNI